MAYALGWRRGNRMIAKFAQATQKRINISSVELRYANPTNGTVIPAHAGIQKFSHWQA
jgi:hypothetical protein